MELNQISNASTFYAADDDFNAVAGEKVKIDVAGMKKFEETVPAGKQWAHIIISMKIEEKDV